MAGQIVVCGELTLGFLSDSHRCGRQEAELASCAESISSLGRTDKVGLHANTIFTSMRLFCSSLLACIPVMSISPFEACLNT